jgi:cytoskeletal protein RodZ
MKANAILYRK